MVKTLLFIFLVYNGTTNAKQGEDRVVVDKTLLNSMDECIGVKEHLEDVLPESLGAGLKKLSIECVQIGG